MSGMQMPPARRFVSVITAEGNLDVPMTRGTLFCDDGKGLLPCSRQAEFCRVKSFFGRGQISAKNKSALAALVSEKLVTGSDGALNVNASITRAEFLTVLYRVAENYITSDALTSGTQGGNVIKGNGSAQLHKHRKSLV